MGRLLPFGTRYLRLLVNVLIHRHPLTIVALIVVTLVLLTFNIVYVDNTRRWSPTPSGSSAFHFWPFKSPFSSSAVHVNIADSPRDLMRLLFGAYRDQHPLTEEEATREAAWRSHQHLRYSAKDDCNNFATGREEAVVHLDRYRVNRRLARQPERAEMAVAAQLAKNGTQVTVGGWHTPRDCQPRETLAIIVPYRDRYENLLTFLNYLHRFLQRQKRRYVVVVAEQANYDVPFNRAKLFNAAVRELLQHRPQIDCFVLHDVDKLPYHLHNLYRCGFQPHQLATMAWNNANKTWTAYYASFFGGVTALSRWQLLRMNGMSNIFYGWGAEDDDMYGRAVLVGYAPSYPSKLVGRMWVIEHHDDMKPIEKRHDMLWTEDVSNRLIKDGLWQVKYEVTRRVQRPLYSLLSFLV